MNDKTTDFYVGVEQQDPGIIEVFQAAESSLKQYLMRFLVSSHDIDDIVQETFVRAWKSAKLQPIHSPRAFLFKIAKNLALSEITRKKNQITQYMGDMEGLNIIDTGLSLEDNLDIHNKLQILSDFIRLLPPQCQKVLIMRKVFGFSHKEIARRMNISTRTVEAHLTRGLKRCQEAMQGAIIDHGDDTARAAVQDD